MNRRALIAASIKAIAAGALAASSLQAAARPPSGGLVDHFGRPFDRSRLSGRWTLLTFGFTQCSSTCPTSMMVARELLETLAPPARPTVVLVTLDPLSDTPQRLRDYLRAFDERLVGVTGDPSAIERAVEAFRVGVRRPENAPLEHSAVWYLLGPDGRVAKTFGYSTPLARLAADVLAIQKQGIGS